MFYKIRQSYGGVWSITNAAGLPYSVAQNFQLNDLGTFVTQFGPAPGINALANAFERVRVMGVKFKITCYPTNDETTSFPICVFANANHDNTYPAPNVGNLPEQRWGKYRVCRQPARGANPTKLVVYYSVNKTWGPDQVVRNDEDFTQQTQSSSPWTTGAPALGPTFQIGLFTIGGTVPTQTQVVTVKVETTIYTKWFGKIELTQ